MLAIASLHRDGTPCVPSVHWWNESWLPLLWSSDRLLAQSPLLVQSIPFLVSSGHLAYGVGGTNPFVVSWLQRVVSTSGWSPLVVASLLRPTTLHAPIGPMPCAQQAEMTQPRQIAVLTPWHSRPE